MEGNLCGKDRQSNCQAWALKRNKEEQWRRLQWRSRVTEAACTHRWRGRQRQSRDAWAPCKPRTNMYAGLMDASQCKTPTPSSGSVQPPPSISVCNYISAAVFESELSFLKGGKYSRGLVCGLLWRKKKIGSRHWGRGANKNVCFNSCQNHFSPDQSAKPRSIICQCQQPGMEQNKTYTAIFWMKPDIATQTCLERQDVWFLVYDKKQTTHNCYNYKNFNNDNNNNNIMHRNMFRCTNAILVFCLVLFIWEIWRYGHQSRSNYYIKCLNVALVATSKKEERRECKHASCCQSCCHEYLVCFGNVSLNLSQKKSVLFLL